MDLSNLYIPKAPDYVTPLKQVIELGNEQQRIGLSREQIGIARESQAVDKARLGILQAEEARTKKTYELMEKRNHMPVYLDDIESPNPSTEYKALTGGAMSLGKEGQNVKSKIRQYAEDMDIIKKNPITGREYLEYADHETIKKMLNTDLKMKKGLAQAKRADLIDAITQIDLTLQNPEKKLKPEEQKMLLQQQAEMKTQLNAADAQLMGYGVDVNGKAGATATDIDDFVARKSEQYKLDTGKEATPGMQANWMKEIKRAQSEEVSGITYAKRNAEAATAERINYNATIGKQLAEIATVKQIEEQKAIGEGKVTDIAKKATAKSRMTGNLATLGNHYLTLDSMGAIVNVNNPSFDNLSAAIKSSGVGQYIGQTFGTSTQSIRESINKLRPLLVQDIRQATDMGARGLDSEKELEFYLNAATNTKTDVQSNVAAIVVLDEAYGNGEIAEQLRELTNETTIRAIKREGLQILKGKSIGQREQRSEQKTSSGNRFTIEEIK